MSLNFKTLIEKWKISKENEEFEIINIFIVFQIMPTKFSQKKEKTYYFDKIIIKQKFNKKLIVLCFVLIY